jgi:enoyl-CoA hydratase
MTSILTQQRGHLFEIILNRPDRRNAIDWPMLQSLGAAIDQAERATGVRAILVRAEGSAFSVGLDLTGLQSIIEQFGEHWRENLFPVTAAMQHILNRVEACSLPTIALLHGYCLGLAWNWRWPATSASRRRAHGWACRRLGWDSSRMWAAPLA